MTTESFRRIFARVCDDFALCEEARRIAWEQCFARAKDGGLRTLKRRVVQAYVALDATRPPFEGRRC